MKKEKLIQPARRPKMTDHFGRTWDTIRVILPDGERVQGYLDTTWGAFIYFMMDNKWKKTRVEEADGDKWILDLRK